MNVENKPYMLLGTPNSGSHWFVDAVLRANPHLTYHGYEFFNPIRNYAHYDKLATEFACELAELGRNLTSRCDDRLDKMDAVMRDTWDTTRMTLAKDVFNSFHTEFWLPRFQCFVIRRTWRECFPTKRLRVVAWYNQIWCSLVQNMRCDRLPDDCLDLVKYCEANARTLQERCVAAQHVLYHRITRLAVGDGISPIDYEVLIHADTNWLNAYLKERLPTTLDASKVAYQVVMMRDSNMVQRESAFTNEWEHVVAFAKRLSADFPHAR